MLREELKKYTAAYLNRMVHYLIGPFLVPPWKFLVGQEVSVITCPRNSNVVHFYSTPATDRVVVGTTGQISEWSISTQKELCSFHPRSVLSCVAIDANARLIVSGHEDGTFMRWDAETGVRVGVRVDAHCDTVNCLAISKGGLKIVTGSANATLRFWNAKNGTPKGTPIVHKHNVTCVAVCESESMIVSGHQMGLF